MIFLKNDLIWLAKVTLNVCSLPLGLSSNFPLTRTHSVFSFAAFFLDAAGVSGFSLLWVLLVSQVSLLSLLSLVSLLPLVAQVSLLSQVLLLPWLPLLTQVPQVPLFQGAALAIGDDVTVGVMIATGFSGAALSQGASAVSGVTL